jgi:hypothetical protein
MEKLTKSAILAILLILATVTLVYAVSVNWGASNNPIYDQTGVGGTVLANGDIVQLVWDQGNDGIDPPDSLGAPTGDDQLLATSAIGVGTFFPGRFSENLNTNLIGVGNQIYVRAWNAGTFAEATHYGDSPLATVSNNTAFTFDATAASSFATISVKPPPLGITLHSLTATCLDGSIVVAWETSSELQTLGFNVLRSEDPLGESSQINAQLIPAQRPGGTTGGIYELVDDSIGANVVYYYWLDEVDISGVSSLHGPTSSTCTITPTAVSLGQFSADATPLRDLNWLWALVLMVSAVLAASCTRHWKSNSSRTSR